MAVRNGVNAPWMQVVGTDGRFAFTASEPVVAIAYYARQTTSVVYVTRTEVATLPVSQLCGLREFYETPPPPKTLVMATNRAGSNTTFAEISLGGLISAAQFGFVGAIQSPLAGAHDLVAVAGGSRDTNRVIIRRGVDVTGLPNGARLSPDLDFASAEALPMPFVPIALSGGGTGGSFWSAPIMVTAGRCQAAFLPRENRIPVRGSRSAVPFVGWTPTQLSPPGEATAWLAIVTNFPTVEDRSALGSFVPPASLLRSGDLLGTVSLWWNLVNPFMGESDYRFHVGTGPSIGTTATLPSQMPRIVPDILPDTAYRRLRFRFQLPADLADAATVQYQGGNRTMVIRVPTSVLQGRAVDITTPDFTGVPGWQSSNGPRGTVWFEIRGEQHTRTDACTPGRTAVSARSGVS
jgi:hypothetical protein